MTEVREPEFLAALFAGILSVAGSFGFGGRTPEFVVAPVAAMVTEMTPGIVMAVAIEWLGNAAQPLAFGFSLVLTVGLFSGIARVALAAGARSAVPFTATVAGFALGWFSAFILIGLVVPALAVGTPLAILIAAAEWRWKLTSTRPTRASRRSVLRAGGAVAGLAGVAAIRGWTRRGVRSGPLSEVTDETVEAAARDRVAAVRRKSLNVDGLDGLVSEEFYEVDINAVDPNPTAAKWTLTVTGSVDTELELTYEDLLARDPEHRAATLRCVGERLNGNKMDTAVWTGVPIADILAEAKPKSDCECVMLRSVDGYFVQFPIAALEPGLLAYGMNGNLLPRAHGYPVRVHAPGHWGEVDAKWVTEMEFLDEAVDGYWEQRGWHGTGPVNTVAKIHAVNHLESGDVELGGHAYAGTRGIATVEVSTDGGNSWAEATLSAPLEEPDTWRQWRYTFSPRQDSHEIVARAIDGEGTLQPRERSKAFPSGPTGWVRRTVDGDR